VFGLIANGQTRGSNVDVAIALGAGGFVILSQWGGAGVALA